MKCCINESKFRADPQIGHLVDKHPELFDENENAAHIVVIFFVMHELGKGADSFWHWYFEISAWSDMPALWSQDELNELHDPILKHEACDELAEMQEEFDEIMAVANANPDCLNLEAFTFDNYLRAHYQVGTRCFGYAIPELSLVPFADNCNHHTTDNAYELFNSRLSTKMKNQGLQSLTETEKFYNTTDRKKIDFHRNFAKAPMLGPIKPLHNKALRYSRKI